MMEKIIQLNFHLVNREIILTIFKMLHIMYTQNFWNGKKKKLEKIK